MGFEDMICFDNEDHGRMIMEAMRSRFSLKVMTVISRVVEDEVIGDELLGGVVYENWTGRGGTCLVHFAGFHPRWINRDLLWVGFHYPFIQLDCKSIFAQVRAKNQQSIDVVRAMGYREITTIEDVYPDDDVILFRLFRDDCRFLKIKPRNLKFGRVN